MTPAETGQRIVSNWFALSRKNRSASALAREITEAISVAAAWAAHQRQAEVERLQRIEAAVKAHKAAWDDGTNSTMAHDTREALWAALEGE